MANAKELIKIITASQKRDGSFMSTTYRNGKPIAFAKTTFCTSLILSALKGIDIEIVKKKALKFLLRHEKGDGSFNYWIGNKEYVTPNDLDDTFLALCAISDTDKKLINEVRLMKSIDLLIRNEVRVGGPYYTWLVPKNQRKSWKDIDIGVNANIMQYLNTQGISSDPLLKFIETRIVANDFASKYYDPLISIYYISKWYRGQKKGILLGKLKRYLTGPFKNPLAASIAVSSYLRLGGSTNECKRAYLFLRKSSPGEFPFSIEEIRDGVPQYLSSTPLTAALMLEATNLYVNHVLKEENDVIEKRLIEKIRLMSLDRFKGVSSDLQYLAAQSIEKVIKRDIHKEITLTPYFFIKGNKYKDSDIIALGSANLLGWIGYTIYDDILDGEDKALLIPLANICIRDIAVLFKNFTSNNKEYSDIQNILDRIDDANLWEHTNCILKVHRGMIKVPKKLPSYGDLSILAYKSLGHAIGPLILCSKYKINSKDTLGFFKNYLIARQLNDDAHDWFIDLKQGFLNPAVIFMLKGWKKRFIDIKHDEPELRSIFWNKTIDVISNEIFRHIKQARIHLKRLSIKNDFFSKRLDSLWDSANEAIVERDKVRRYLKSIKSKV